MNRFATFKLCLLMLTLGLMIGCQSAHQDPRLAHLATPTDFAVELFVQTPDIQQRTIDGQAVAMRYVVEPNRRLRAWEGPRVTADRLPPSVRTLTAGEMEQIVSLVEQYELMAEPISPLAQAYLDTGQAEKPLYHVTLTARGRTTRFITTGTESPPTARLLSMLQQLARQSIIQIPDLSTAHMHPSESVKEPMP